MSGGDPVVPAQRLGRELRHLRDAVGKTQVEVAKYVGTPSTMIICTYEQGTSWVCCRPGPTPWPSWSLRRSRRRPRALKD